MNAGESSWQDEQHLRLLAACDEALAAGAPPSLDPPGIPADLRAQLACEVAWCQLVRQCWAATNGATLPSGTTLADLVRPTSVPLSQIGRFQVRRELGHGTFGVVFLAYDPRLDREVALKVPRAEALHSPEVRARFQQEARAAAGLEHPNLVPVYDAGEEGGVCYIASAYCPGQTLAAWLRQRTEAVPSRSAAQLVAVLADAVEHAHRRGVLHRDLKPANILLSVGQAFQPDSGRRQAESLTYKECQAGKPDLQLADYEPRITDFGLAKLLERTAGEEAGYQTQSGAILGTPSYMAPEQATGRSREVGPASDIYALGAILYELLTRRPPFVADTALETLLLVGTQDPLPPARLRLKLPQDLETICLKCLCKNPRQRYGSAQELAEDLRRYLANEPIRARRVRAAGRLVRWCRRNPALAGTVAVALALLATVAALSYWQVAAERDRYRQERDHAQRERERAEGNLYRALVGEARAQVRGRDTGWWWKALDNIHEAARLDLAPGDRVELRELAIECMGSEYPCCRLRGEWKGHEGAVSAVALSPDGRLAASAGRDRTVWLWSVPDGQAVAVLVGHTGPVRGLAFHPRGRRLASSSADGTVRWWSLGTQDAPPGPDGVFPLGAGEVGALEFSPDGTCLAAACQDGTIHLLATTADGLPPPTAPGPSLDQRVLKGHSGRVTGLAFTSTGKQLASGAQDSTVRLWDLSRGRQILSWPSGHPVSALAFSPRGDVFASAEPESYGFAARYLPTGTVTAHNQVHAGAVSQLRFDGQGRLISAARDGTLKWWWPTTTRFKEVAVAQGNFAAAVLAAAPSQDGGCVVVGYADGWVRLWEVGEAPQRRFLAAPQSVAFVGSGRLVTHPVVQDLTADGPASQQPFDTTGVAALASHPDGRRFACAAGGTLRVWDLPGRRELLHWEAHKEAITSLAGSPDGERLASVSADGTVKLWDWETGRQIRTLQPGLGVLHAVAWGGAGRHLAASGERGVAVWDQSGEAAPRIWEHDLPLSAVALSPDSRTLAVSAVGGAVELRDLQTGATRQTLSGHSALVSALAFSPDGRRLASAAADETVRLWDPATGQFLKRLEHAGQNGTFLAFDPRDRYLVVGDLRVTLLWDLRSGTLAATLPQARASGRFTCDGSALLLGTYQGAVEVCALAAVEAARAAAAPEKGVVPAAPVSVESTDQLVQGGHTSAVWGVAASPDGRWIATASHDGTVKLWDAQTLKLVRTLIGHRALVWCVAFSPDSKFLASGSGTVKVWEVASGQEVCELVGHEALVASVAFHPRRPWLASSGLDGSVWLWDLEARRPLCCLHRFDQAVYSVGFRPDGRYLAAACLDNRVALWELADELPRSRPPDRFLTGHRGSVWSVGFSPDGRYLASGSEQGFIILWDGTTFARVVTLRAGAGQVRCVAFNPESQLLVGSAYTAPAVVWDLGRLHRSLAEMNLDW